MPYVADAPLRSLFTDDYVDGFAREITVACGLRLLELVTDFTPVSNADPRDRGGRRPGALKDSWEMTDVDVRGNVYSITVQTFDKIAPHVEYPTRPHIIRPRADRQAASVVSTRGARGTVQDGRAMLRFVAGGRVVYAAEVRHPGTKGARMMGRAIDQLSREWPGIAVQARLTPGDGGALGRTVGR